MRELLAGFAVQKRVIMALMLRETHTIYGDSKLGYLWVVIQSAFNITVFWGVRKFVGSSDPHGLPTAIYLIVGFGVWYVISQSIVKCLNAVKANQNLLTFPQVTELDVMVSRVIVVYFTQLVVTIFLLGVSGILGTEMALAAPGLLIYCILMIPLFGLGVGLLSASLAVFIPVLERLVPLMLRLLFFISGVFFSVTAFSDDIARVLRYNPILQFVELTRCAIGISYPRTGLSILYSCVITLAAVFLGLLLERYVRSRRER